MHPVISPQLTLYRCVKKSSPHRLDRGSATTDQIFAYFTPDDSKSVYGYELSTEKWEHLPPCPYRNSALVIIDGSLTAVGGWDGARRTNKLFTLRQKQWVEEYPPMNTASYYNAVVRVSGGNYIVVIGGQVDDDCWTTTVELFHVSSRKWYELTDLPQRLSWPSAAIYVHQLYVTDVDGYGFSCSLQALPSSDQPITSESIRQLLSWTPLPSLPVTHATAATLRGQLVIVGGRQEWTSVNSSHSQQSSAYSIHQLLDGQWVLIGSMVYSRWSCFVVTPSSEKMIIVGGVGAYSSVEECIVCR